MPSTDTRELARELRDNADWLALGARHGMELSPVEVADLVEILTRAAHALTSEGADR